MEIEEVNCQRVVHDDEPLPLLSLNHVSLLCRSVWTSVRFYEEVLGFVLVKRPSSFDFPGAWLFNYGIGIHLLQSPELQEYDPITHPRPINPKDNHISFQCNDMEKVKRRLKERGMRYVTGEVAEGGMKVDQVFFHDPDGYMIEICNCDLLPILPLSPPPHLSINRCHGGELRRRHPQDLAAAGSTPKSCGLFTEAAMMEILSLDMLNFSF